ncbi:MAG: DUF4386 domain-containing protein [Anaerolineae bacterium]|nr:DUF4386 domain-containing protein [Anaerolineae bacterium]
MNSHRRTAIVVGVLLILATVLNVIGTSSSRPILNDPDYLVSVAANQSQVMVGAVLELIAALAVAGIVVVLYPILKKQDPTLALGSLAFRLIEAVFYCVAVVSLLVLLTLSQAYVAAGTAEAASFEAAGTLILAARTWGGEVAVIAFTLGGLMYYYVFYRTKLIPRWLSVFGLIAVVLLLTAVLISLLNGGSFAPTGGMIVLVFPIAVQEMVMALWLILKGFSPSAVASKLA